MSQTRVDRWETRSEWPLAAIAALFLGAYAWPILDEQVRSPWREVCKIVDYGAWAIFFVDYVARLVIAEHRMRYWSRHLPDLAVVALPVLRPLRLLRIVMLLRVLNRRATDSLRGRVVVYVVGAALILVLCASLAILDAERHAPGANITTFADALWWATATVCTVGYGDRYPVTTEGRGVATGLMIGGIALIGVVTASFATWLIDKVRAVEEDAQAITQSDLKAIMAKLDELSAQVSALERRDRESV